MLNDLLILLETPLLSISQLFSLVGTTLLSVNFILAIRSRLVENAFDGLDKVYKVHHITGALAYVFLLSHPVLLIINAIFQQAPTAIYIFPGSDLSYNFGIGALFFLTLMLILTLFIKLPYNLWKITHKFMGFVLILAIFHIVNIKSDVARYAPLRYWILFLLISGLISYLYKLIFYRFLGPKFRYKVVKITKAFNIIELILKPTNKVLSYQPGQFVFIKTVNSKISQEEHPFSISSPNNETNIRLSVKKLGDFTSQLENIKTGDLLDLYGPYGKLYERFYSGKDIICVAGGIGITPFLSLLGSIPNASNRKVWLFYSVRSGSESYKNDEPGKLSNLKKDFKYELWKSDTRGLITVSYIQSVVGKINNKLIYLCGPRGMMSSLTRQFVGNGVSTDNIIFEDFSLK